MRFVIDSRYVRGRPSGIGAYVEALVERLPLLAPDERFHLWTHPERAAAPAPANVSCRVIAAPADGLRTLLWPTLLDRLEPDDVVHFPFSLLGRGIPCASVVTIHDLMWLEQPGWVDSRPLLRRLRQPYYQAGMRQALAAASRILTVSHATADRIRAVAPRAAAKIRVTPNAVAKQFRPAPDGDEAAARAAAIVGSDAPYFLVVGKNEPYKGHELAVRAFAAAAAADEQLVLVQRTKRGRGLHRLVHELGIVDRVRWLPDLGTEELVTVLGAARALLQPSLAEGFGMPVLEAMACGCPVIASDAEALVEVLDGAGLHTARGSALEIAGAIRKLRDPGLVAELRAKGLERARDFSWDATAAATLQVYREAAVLGGRGDHD
jgi:glycosyltransferase involved in cell wall biosynthesis